MTTPTPWTPGPWAVAEDDANGQAVVRGEHIEICTCWHHSVGAIENEMRFNARLIAEAPAMAEALIDLVEWLDCMSEYQEGRERARAILTRVGVKP
jgi:hypothetical protein